MPTNTILNCIELIVKTWVTNTPQFMQPMFGWKVYWFFVDKLG